MPTPTIDPVAYEAAYAAAKQFRIDESVHYLIGLAVVCFVVWLFTNKEENA